MPLQTLFPGTFLNTTAVTPNSVSGLQGWWSADNGVTNAPLLRLNGAPTSSTNGPTTLTAPDSSGLRIGSSAFAFTFWAVVENTAVAQTLFSKYETGLGGEYIVSVDAGRLTLFVVFGVSPFIRSAQSTAVITSGVPFQGLVGWDGTGFIYTMVNNDSATIGLTAHTTALSTGTAPFRIGAYDGTLGPLTGSIGQINLHKRNLTGDEYNEYYNSGNGTPYSSYSTAFKVGLISHWSLTDQPAFNKTSRQDSHGTNHITGGTGLLTNALIRGGKAARAAANNEAISNVADRSGNGRTLSAITLDTGVNYSSINASSANLDFGPFYRTNQLNSLPTLTFPGPMPNLGRSFTMPQPAHIFTLMKVTSWGSDTRFINGNSNTTSFKLTGGANTSELQLNAGSAGPSNAALEVGRWQVVEIVLNGSNSYVQINGTRSSISSAGSQALGGLYFGQFNAESSALTAKLEWAETALYDSILPHNTASGIRKYLYDKWGGGSNGTNWPAFNPDKLVVFDGNSLTAGHFADVCYGQQWQAMEVLGATWTMMDITRGGKTLAESVADSVSRTSAFYNPSRSKNVFFGAISPDRLADAAPGGPYTARQIVDLYWSYTDAVRAVGWTVVACTPLAIGSHYGGGGGFEAKRQTMIGLMQAEWTSHADALCDVGSDATFGGASAFNNMTYFASDRVHLNNNGATGLGALFAASISSV